MPTTGKGIRLSNNFQPILPHKIDAKLNKGIKNEKKFLLLILELTLIMLLSCASTVDRSGAGNTAPRSAVQASAIGGTAFGPAREFGESAYEEVGNSGLFSGHSAENSRIASRKKEKKAQPSINAAEIQGAVMSFADTFGAMVGQYATELEYKATSIQGRLNASRMKLFGISSALQIASGPYPGVALLDMIVLMTLNRIVWEEYWLPEVYGKQADSMVDALKKLEAEIWATVAKVLTAEQQNELKELILEWRKKNPLKTEVNYVRFSDFGELGRKPTLEKPSERRNFVLEEQALSTGLHSRRSSETHSRAYEEILLETIVYKCEKRDVVGQNLSYLF